MEQKVIRFSDGDVSIECKMTLKEKLDVLFSKGFALKIDGSVNSDTGVVYEYYKPFIMKGTK